MQGWVAEYFQLKIIQAFAASITTLEESGDVPDPAARGAEATPVDQNQQKTVVAAGTVEQLKSMSYQAVVLGMPVGSVVKAKKAEHDPLSYVVTDMEDDKTHLTSIVLGSSCNVIKISTSDLIDNYKPSSEKVPIQLSGWYTDAENETLRWKLIEAEVIETIVIRTG